MHRVDELVESVEADLTETCLAGFIEEFLLAWVSGCQVVDDLIESADHLLVELNQVVTAEMANVSCLAVFVSKVYSWLHCGDIPWVDLVSVGLSVFDLDCGTFFTKRLQTCKAYIKEFRQLIKIC